MLVALVDQVVPAPGTDGGPGAAETKLVARLEQRLAASPELRAIYTRGMAAIDRVARRRGGRAFADLDAPEQFQVLARIDRAVERTRWTRDACVVLRAARRARRAWYTVVPIVRPRMGEASRFFPRLVDDVFETFYTASASWEWLGYDGPPMSEGYAELTQPRQNAA